MNQHQMKHHQGVTPHGICDTISGILASQTELRLGQSLIFHLLGSYTCEIKRRSNDSVPVYEVRGHQLQYDRMFPHTGIKITRMLEFSAERALATTMEALERDSWQLVLANCFFLPYDAAAYRKTADNHLVLIHGYDPETDEFLITAPGYDDVRIGRDVLMTARFKSLPKQYVFQYLRLEFVGRLPQATIIQNVRSLVRARAAHYREHHGLEQLKLVLAEIDACAGICRNVAANHLTKELRHPNSMIRTRERIAESCRHLAPGLASEYRRLSDLWLSFAGDVARLGHGTLTLEQILARYDEVIALELALNEAMHDALQDGRSHRVS